MARRGCVMSEPMTWKPALPDLVAALSRADRYEAARYMAQHRALHPRFLYKFAPPIGSRLASVVVASQLWFASRDTLNDLHDMRVEVIFKGTPSERLRYFRGAARRVGVKGRERVKAAQQAYARIGQKEAQQIFDEHIARYGVCCFAARAARKNLMWAHYASAHKGVCFQFHAAQAPALLTLALPVRYRNRGITLNWLKDHHNEERIGLGFFQKAVDWSHECEHRVLRHGAANTEDRARPRSGIDGDLTKARLT
jgi:hypothetical protein